MILIKLLGNLFEKISNLHIHIADRTMAVFSSLCDILVYAMGWIGFFGTFDMIV